MIEVSDEDDEHMRRLRWACRRGLLELDLVFMRFLETVYHDLNASEQATFERLLALPDHTILNLLNGGESTEDEAIAKLLRAFRS